jgi:D-glycero-alpha-D-manno-heptose-7-phosphate kinase
MTTTCPYLLSTPRPARAPLRRVVASAPMRVSFAGGGTDLPHIARWEGGRVVGTAVDLRARAVVEPFDRGWVRLGSPGGDVVRRSADPSRRDLGFRLLEAVLAAAGVRDGVALRVEADVAPGAGLGGSASAAIAALFALRAALGEPAPLDQLARDASSVERDRLGIACGGQDQVFAAFGGMLDLSFNAHGCSGVRPLYVARGERGAALVAALEAGLLLVDTGVRRVSGDVLNRMLSLSAASAAGELVAAAGEVVRGFEAGSLEQVLAGMRRSAAAKLRRSAGASAIAAALAARLRGTGAEVVRMCGAGGGGHVLVWAPAERHHTVLAALGPQVVRRPTLNAQGVRLEEM